MLDPVMGAIWYAVLVFSLVFHEAAHAWAALRGGDPTAYLGGQVSLDPRPHIRREPFGMVVVPLLFYATGGMMLGWASTPYDPRWAASHPRRAAWMALAGPAANLTLVAVAALVIWIGVSAGVFRAPMIAGYSRVTEAALGGSWSIAASILSVLFSLNLLLVVFNLIPLPPLDGASVVPLLVSEPLAMRYAQLLRRPGFSMAGLLLAWFMLGSLFSKIHALALNLLYPGVHYG